MSSFFDPNTPIMRALARLFDFLLLSLLFILCSIPIITVGQAASALYRCAAALKSGSSMTPADFFLAFRQSAKKAIPAWLLVSAAAILFTVNFRMIETMPSGIRLFMLSGNLFLLFCLLLTAVSLFPLIDRQSGLSLRKLFSHALFIGIAHLPRVILIVLLLILPMILLLFAPTVCFALSFLWIFFWPAIVAYAEAELLGCAF